jgi:hypothetical protein
LQRVGRVPARCVVIGNSNAVIEAAHDAGMRCVAVLSASKPAYELASADLVVRQLDELSIVNLKQLFAMEDLEGQPQLQVRPPSLLMILSISSTKHVVQNTLLGFQRRLKQPRDIQSEASAMQRFINSRACAGAIR